MWSRLWFLSSVIATLVLASAEPCAANTARVRLDGDAALVAGLDRGPLLLPGPVTSGAEALRLIEIGGAPVTIRVTPVDEVGEPVNGGRVVVLRANEERTLGIDRLIPSDDVIGRRFEVATLRGAGRVEVVAPWLTPSEVETVAMPAGNLVPRRHLEIQTTSSLDLIDQGVAAGTLDAETAIVYKTFALFADARLPEAYRGNDRNVFDSLELDEVRGAYPTLSPANQALVQPFLVPPIYQESWAGGYSAGQASILASPPSCALLPNDWKWFENPGGVVRVWYSVESDAGAALAILNATEGTIWPKLAGLMTRHVPLFDDTEFCNGGSLAIDIYLTDLPYDGLTVPYNSGGAPTPVYILVQRTANLATVAHELFHAFEYSYKLGASLTNTKYLWWAEAAAAWAEDYVYPNVNDEHGWAATFINTPEKPLDTFDRTTLRHYGAYLVPFYVYKAKGLTSFMPTSWESCESQDALHALDAALPGGFAAIWPEVALHNWNEKPVDQYQGWDHLNASPPQSGLATPTTLGGSGEAESTSTFKLPHLSATYQDFVISDLNARSIAFWNGASWNLKTQDVAVVGPFWNPQALSGSGLGGIKVQAIIKIADHDPIVKDWTNKPYQLYCRDLTDEHLQELVIVISNSELTDRSGLVSPQGQDPRLYLSSVGCWQWKGTATYTETGPTGTQTDTATVTWTRTSDSLPPRIDYQPSGTVTVSLSGQCTGGGTVPITVSTNSMTTFNYTPLSSAARRSYTASGFEQAMVPVTCQGQPGFAVVGPWALALPGNPPALPFNTVRSDGTMRGTMTQVGLTWTWTWQPQRQ